jgi:SagB-type dehydrogenase family enzyme
MLDSNIQKELIQKGRHFTQGYRNDDPYEDLFESDQTRKLPQPPLVKAPVTPKEKHISLTRDFSALSMKNSLLDLIRDRRSARIYTQEDMPLDQLSFLLWATQGVKGLRGKSYATLRTVPSGGARHPFETYLVIRKVDNLKPGVYHYLPLEHELEFLHEIDDLDAKINESLCGQSWAAKANVLFYWSMVPYRAEWRYGIYAHRVALMDAGHMAENLYLACTGIGLGCCAIGAFRDELCSELFTLDGEEEFMLYVVPVGTVRSCDRAEEQSFYKFVEDEGL